ncbi:MiaB/RimO family radical SAM methylthiotransferase, partial [Patescibacteria group bacterium]
MKYYIKTFGCQMNYSDSERIATVLEKQGFRPASDIKKANLAIFNTCGVRQMAEDRVYGQIHNLRKSQLPSSKSQTNRTIVLTGCLANRPDVRRRLKDKVELFCEIKEFPQKIKALLASSSKGTTDPYLSIKPSYSSKFSAFVPVMTGCNNFCSYCVVPYARGREISRPATEILKEVRSLVKNGYKFITLVGQNVNSYQDNKISFPSLLKKANAIPGKFWLSFMTSHPKDMSDDLIKVVAQSPKVCEFVHLPIQAGDDKILKAMNRKYTRAHYLKLIAKIKKAFQKYKPGQLYGLAGDIIVGFPGETKKQFLESAKVLEKVRYDMLYFGQFSPRYGTAAAKMKDNVSKKEKERRENYLNAILKDTAINNNR